MKHVMRCLIILLFPAAVMAQPNLFYPSVKLQRSQIHKVMMAVSAPAVIAGAVVMGA